MNWSLGADRTIGRKHGPISASKKAPTDATFSFVQELHDFGLRHPGKIINPFTALAAKARPVVPLHVFPARMTRGCDADTGQKLLIFVHK